jgi:hypothetical protein
MAAEGCGGGLEGANRMFATGSQIPPARVEKTPSMAFFLSEFSGNARKLAESLCGNIHVAADGTRDAHGITVRCRPWQRVFGTAENSLETLFFDTRRDGFTGNPGAAAGPAFYQKNREIHEKPCTRVFEVSNRRFQL